VLAPEDLADLVAAAAAVKLHTPSCARLLDAISAEVHTQLSNRHSANEVFQPAQLVKLLSGYAALGYTDGGGLALHGTRQSWDGKCAELLKGVVVGR